MDELTYVIWTIFDPYGASEPERLANALRQGQVKVTRRKMCIPPVPKRFIEAYKNTRPCALHEWIAFSISKRLGLSRRGCRINGRRTDGGDERITIEVGHTPPETVLNLLNGGAAKVIHIPYPYWIAGLNIELEVFIWTRGKHVQRQTC